MFLLGAVFGKLIELSGFAQSIVSAIVGVMGRGRTVLTVVLVCALLTYGGVSLFVVVFAVYPFAAEMFRQALIPKRLIPATLALGAFSFTMDALPGTPQIQNIIPTTFFGTTAWAAPVLGCIGSIFILTTGVAYLAWRVRRAAGEGYGTGHIHEPEEVPTTALVHPGMAILPLIAVPACNLLLGVGDSRTVRFNFDPRPAGTELTPDNKRIQHRKCVGSGRRTSDRYRHGSCDGISRLRFKVAEGSKLAVGGALLATMNTGLGVRFRGRDLCTAGLRRGTGYPRHHLAPALECFHHNDDTGRHHWLCLWRLGNRLGSNVDTLYLHGAHRRNSVGSDAPRNRNGQRRNGRSSP